jgi:hypothetical protein
MEWAGHVILMAQMRNAYKILAGRPERMRLLGRHRRRWGNNIIMELREIGWKCVGRIHVAQVKDQWWALVSF